MSAEATLGERVAAEIVDLHAFFVRWLDAVRRDPGLSLDRFASVAAPGFRLIGPSGAVLDRQAVIDWLARSRASRGGPEHPFAITAEQIDTVEVAPGLCLATYVERQTGPAAIAARRSSALFRDAAGTPHGVEWLHVHETEIAAATA